MKLADIVIPHHNRHDHLNRLLEKLDNKMFNIIIVSGNSFAENCNKGAKIAETDNLIFLNDDTLPNQSDLVKMCNQLKTHDLVGSTQIAKDNVKYYGIGLETIGNFITHRIQIKPGNSILPSAFCIAIKKDKWQKLNGFDVSYKTGNEDVDFGLRAINENLKMIILDLEIKHFESQSDGRFKYCKENNDMFEKMYSQKYLKETLKTAKDINQEKKLKIAITCNTMEVLSGSPVYHYTLAKELAKQGYSIDFYSGWGKYYKDLDDYGVNKLDVEQAKGNYDLLLISQDMNKAIINKINVKKVFNIVHSEYDCETPIISDRINQYIAIRPEIKEHLVQEHNIDENKIKVIYNGVNLDIFNPGKRKLHDGDYTKVVLPCTFDELRLPFINYYTRKASENYRVTLIGQSFNKKFYTNEFVTIHNEVEDIENYIADADFVAGILLGRVNLEAHAMGIPSFIHNPTKPDEITEFKLKTKKFNKRHNIVNVAKDIIKTYEILPFTNTATEMEQETKIDKKTQQIFTNIFDKTAWGNKETISGSGSNLQQTDTLRTELPNLFADYNIKSILDIPCGDFYWFSKMDLKNINYIGADIVDKLIEKNNKNYNHKFLKLDIINSKLPKADIVIVRDCFVHFPYKDIKQAIENIKQSGAKYLLTTSFTTRNNIDIPMGNWRPINLQAEPFNMHNPICIVNENCTEANGTYSDKSMILIELDKI